MRDPTLATPSSSTKYTADDVTAIEEVKKLSLYRSNTIV